MKKLWNILVLTLAMNFIAVAGAVGWLWQSGHLDRQRAATVKQVLFPPPPPESPATQPSSSGPATPSQRLRDLLARRAGLSAVEQVQLMQQTFDVTSAQLDRRESDVTYREEQVAHANAKLAEDRKTLEADRLKLTQQQQLADRLANDKGFQDTLALYTSMPTRQVKSVFMTMDEQSVADYLDAMPPRTAARIIKEFKSGDELERVKRVMDKMRHPPALASAAAGTTEGKE